MKIIRSLVLSLFAVASVVAIEAHAQSFTPVEYNFSDTVMVNEKGFVGSSNISQDYFTYSAANGYGNWCVTNTGLWMLMSNSLGDSTSQQSVGEVAKGSLGFVDPNADNANALDYKDIKVATNLAGDVRYVWPLTTNNGQSRKNFIVKGFSEKLKDTVLPSIDISFYGFPKPVLNRQVIKSDNVRQYKTISAGNLAIYTARTISLDEKNWQDIFDIAMDAQYLYIVWEVREQAPLSRYRIMYTVVDIDKDSVVITPRFIAGEGRRPTIACNVRNNENSINPSPEFDIAYISAIPQIGDPWAGNEAVRHFAYFNNAPQSDQLLTRLYYDPNNLGLSPRPLYAKPMHARILVSSYRDLMIPHPPVPKAVYVIADDGDDFQLVGNLFMHPILYPNIQTPHIVPTAYYVDGTLLNRRPSPLTAGFRDVKNTPIVAFANPYDGEPSPLYDEFHCVYIVDLTSDTISTQPSALHIVRGFNNSYNTGLDNDKRLILSKTGETPVEILTYEPEHTVLGGMYTASVNQMGIFAHWHNKLFYKRYYKRDIRKFDENIEENTLITNKCILSNGESHGGTKTVFLKPDKKMTIWSDPAFIGHDNDNTHRRGILALQGSGVSLNIGSQLNPALDSSCLTVLPNYQIVFSTNASDSQKIVINEKSFFHHYGSPIRTPLDTIPNISGTGKIILNEGDTTSFGGELIVHGGSLLIIPDNITLELTPYSKLLFKMEQSIHPPLADTSLEEFGLNIFTTGKLRLHGTFISNHADIEANIWEPTTVIEVRDPLITGSGLPTTQFTAIGTSFTGGNCIGCGIDFGLWGMRIAWSSPNTAPIHQFRKIYVNNCLFKGTSLSIMNPIAQVVIDSSSFWRILEPSVTLTWSRSTNGYGDIFVRANEVDLKPIYYLPDASMQDGMKFTGFSQKREDGIEKITISDNVLYSYGESPQPEILQAGIFLQNTSALVLNNSVSGAGFNNGIVNKFTPPSSSTSDRSNSLFCTNVITGCENGAGLLTENWKGHARMNIIEECLIGHQSEDRDEGGVMYSRYSNNLKAGLFLDEDFTKVDLRGIHSQDISIPAYDTIDHNNTLKCDSCGQIVLDDSELLIGTALRDSASLAVFGHNTFVMSDSDEYMFNNISFSLVSNFGYFNNFFGIGAWGAVMPITRIDTLRQRYLKSFTYQYVDTLVSLPATAFSNPDTPVCGIWYDWGAKPHIEQQPQSVMLDSEYCRWLEERVDRNSQSNAHKIVVDSGKLFIEQCANYDDAWRAFFTISYSLDFLKSDSNRYINHVGWLKDVLYLNTQDSAYWCADVTSILYTFHYIDNRGKADGLGAIAILKYVKESGRCSKNSIVKDYDELYRFYMDETIQHWRDTVKDSIATPLDTTLPSLEDLDLDILRGKSGVVSGGAVSNAPRLSYVTAERNPFTDEVALKVELSTSTMLRLDIYDELGRTVYGEAFGYKQKGDHRFSVSGKTWADGVYYARISTSGGEIQTVKLIKQ